MCQDIDKLKKYLTDVCNICIPILNDNATAALAKGFHETLKSNARKLLNSIEKQDDLFQAAQKIAA